MEGREEGGEGRQWGIKVGVRELEGRKLGREERRRKVRDVGGSRDEEGGREGWRVKKEGEREGGTEGRREVRRKGGREPERNRVTS